MLSSNVICNIKLGLIAIAMMTSFAYGTIESSTEAESPFIPFEGRPWAEAVMSAASANDSIVMEGGRLKANTIWAPPKTHLVFNSVYVPSGITLTIVTNAVVKFCEGTFIKVENGGTLDIIGAEGKDVILTTANDETAGVKIPGLDSEQSIKYKGIILQSTSAKFTDNGWIQIRGFNYSSYPSVSINDLTALRSKGMVMIPVTVTGTRNQSFMIDWAAEDGTAKFGTDYTVASGSITWENTSSQKKYIEIPLVADHTVGSNTTFKVRITAARGAYVVKGEITVTITETDFLEIDSDFAESNPIRFESRPWAEAVYNTAITNEMIIIEGGRLEENAVWDPPETHLIFNSVYIPSGITLTIVTNTVVKFCEGTFIKVEDGGKLNIIGAEGEDVILTSANDDSVGEKIFGLDPEQAIEFPGIILQSSNATFRDNNWLQTRGFNFSSYPYISVNDLTALRSTGIAMIPLTINGTRYQTFSIDWEAEDGTATLSNDYLIASGRVTWANSSEGAKNIEIPLATDHIVGSNTTFKVRITAARGINITKGECVVTIAETKSTKIDSGSSESAFIRFESRPWAEAVMKAASADNKIVLEGGRLKKNTTWGPPKTHLVFNSVYVPNGITLTIVTNTVVKFCEGTFIKVEDGGKLNITGAENKDVILTAANDDTVGQKISGLESDETIVFRGIVLSSDKALLTDNGHLDTRGFNVSRYPTLTLHKATADRNSGYIYLPITLNDVTRNQAFSIDWVAVEGSAKFNKDYKLASGSITWANSYEGRKDIVIPIEKDHIVGSNVTFTVRFSALHGVNADNKEVTATVAEFKTGEITFDSVVELIDSEASSDTSVDEGIQLRPFFLNDVESIRYSGKWQDYDAREADKLRVTIESDNGLSILKEVAPSEEGSFELKISDYPIGIYTLKHEIVDAQGTTLATMQKRFSVLDMDNVEIHGGTLTQDEVWTSNKVHVVYTTVYVPTTYTLFIEPGTIVKFMNGTGIELLGKAAFFANTIVFTSIDDDTIGGDTLNDGYTGKPPIDSYFLIGDFHFSGDTELRNITQSDSLTGTISTDKILNRGCIYRVSGDLNIADGATLTIPPGTILKMEKGASINVNGGTLIANGTHAAPIIITSIKDDSVGGDTNKDGNSTEPQPGDWRQICIASGSFEASYLTLTYLSSDNNEGGVYVLNGTANMDCCTIAHCEYDCMRSRGGVSTVRNSIFTDSSIGVAPSWGTNYFINCVFNGLTTAVRWQYGDFVNCVFSEISLIFFDRVEETPIRNCVLWNPENYGPQTDSVIGENNNLWGDPLFIDTVNGDFRIVEGSPCVDAADNEFAPETDYFGHPRVTITDQGTNTVGQLADIGICEVMPRNITSDVDLIPQNINVNTNAVPGQQLFIKWEVANIGGKDISGSWRDTVYLVSESGLEIELGEKVTTGTIGAGGSVFCSGTFIVPVVSEGIWYTKVNVNSYHDIFEGNLTTNNALVCDKSIAVTIKPTDLSTPQSDVIYAGVPKVLKLSLNESDENRMVSFNVPKGVKITWGFGTMPSSGVVIPGLYGSSISDGSTPIQFRAPDGATDVYVILESDEPATYELSTDSAKLSLISVSPNTLPSSGTTTISATCTGYGVTNVLVLVNGGDRVELPIESIDVYGNLVASIDCSKLSAGKTYDAILTSDDNEAILKQAVKVTQEEGRGILEYESELPSSARPGRIFTFLVKYRNVGNKDLCCPILTIQDTGDDEVNPMQFSIDGVTFIPGELKFVGLDANGYLDAIHPGDEVVLHIMARIPPANNGSASISVRVNSESDIMAQYTTEIDQYITPMMRLEYEQSTNEEFRVYFENLQKLLGSNNGEMVRNFAALAKKYFDNNWFFLLGIENLIAVGIDTINNEERNNTDDEDNINFKKLIKQLSSANINSTRENEKTGAYLYDTQSMSYVYITEGLDDLSEQEVVVIAHGLNDSTSKDDLWMRKMGSKLMRHGFRIIIVNWSKEASFVENIDFLRAVQFGYGILKGGKIGAVGGSTVGAGIGSIAGPVGAGIGAVVGGAGGLVIGGMVGASPAALQTLKAVSGNIPDVATIVYNQLQYCKINPKKTIFIGHSFGSHLLAYVARNYIYQGGIKRHIGLDTAAHLAVSGKPAGADDANMTEYYRSSSGSGCAEPYAKYNYIVAEKGGFEDWKGGSGILDNFYADHSYAIKWFTESIDHEFDGVGFWAVDGKPRKLQNLGKDGYSGVINENRIVECTYRFGEPYFYYPGNQPNWVSTYYSWIKTFDLDIRDDGHVGLQNGAVLKTGKEILIPIDIKDHVDINTVERHFYDCRMQVVFYDSNGDMKSVIDNHFFDKLKPIKLKLSDIYIPSGMASVNGDLAFYISPYQFDFLDDWHEIYHDDNFVKIPVTIQRSNGPTASINGRRDPDFVIEKKVRFSTSEKFDEARNRNDKVSFEFTSKGSSGGDSSITSYEWQTLDTVDGYQPSVNGFWSKPNITSRMSSWLDAIYPISLTVSNAAGGSDSVSGYLHIIPVIKDDPEPIEQPHSCDPNEMSGPLGIGDPETERFVVPGEWLTYTVYFENTSNATAAAQEVYVTNPLNKYLDWSSFEMGDIAFNNQIDLGLAGMQSGTSEVAANGTNYNVRTQLELDKENGSVKWYMRIVDPSTETGWPDDILVGFLPPNDETYRGEGHLSYRIKVREDAPAGVTINNSATIVFDYNDPIETDPAWWNKVAQMQKVSFDDGSTNVNLVVGMPYGKLPVPGERKGWTFVGWFTGPDGTGRQITEDSIVEEGDDMLYQHWVRNKHDLIDDDKGMAVASVYDGYVYDPVENRTTKGSIQAKVGKTKNGKAKVSAAIVMAGGEKTEIKGEMDATTGTLIATAKNGRPTTLTFGENDLSGTYGEFEIDGARNIFVSKNGNDQAAANAALSAWGGVHTMVWDDGPGYAVASISIGSKGKTKVVGWMGNGTKFSASGQLIVGKKESCVTIVSTNNRTPLAFNLWFEAGEETEFEGISDYAIISTVGPLVPDAFFMCGFLTESVPIVIQKGKWTVNTSKETALKLSYKDKTGTFKGSFKVNKQKAIVNGVVVDGVGYGSAVMKNAGFMPVVIDSVKEE